MNENQLKDAAYKLCKLRGQDPEEFVEVPPPASENGEVLSYLCNMKRWELTLAEITNFIKIQQAISQTKFDDSNDLKV